MVPSFQLCLITLVGSNRWGYALRHPLHPNRKGGRDNQKLHSDKKLCLITLVGSNRWGYALPHPLHPNRKGGRDNQKLGTTATL